MVPNIELAYKFGDNRQTIFLDECPDSVKCKGEWIGSLNGTKLVLVCIVHSRVIVRKNKETDQKASPNQPADDSTNSGGLDYQQYEHD